MGAREVVEAATAGEARARAHVSGPRELCVLDLGLPDGSGLDLLSDLRSRRLAAPGGPVGRRRPLLRPGGVRRRRAGLPAEVGVAGRRRRRRAPRARGRVYADPAVASLLAAGLRSGPVDSGVADLSGREIEVLRLVSDGQSNKQIGEELGLSALTVKSHLARIARKLGTGDRAEMVAMAMRGGVIR
jgi:DNA-binding NarL/FixJ family response regulator